LRKWGLGVLGRKKKEATDVRCVNPDDFCFLVSGFLPTKAGDKLELKDTRTRVWKVGMIYMILLTKSTRGMGVGFPT
jgi:hypothetical protein